MSPSNGYSSNSTLSNVSLKIVAVLSYESNRLKSIKLIDDPTPSTIYTLPATSIFIPLLNDRPLAIVYDVRPTIPLTVSVEASVINPGPVGNQ